MTPDALFIQSSVAGFLVAILAGIFLAAAFQLVLTNLLIALGISITGNIEEKVNQPKKAKQPEKSAAGKITMAVGIASMLTLGLAMLGAAYFAVRLTFVESTALGMTLGLVIWAAYFVVMLYVEMKSVSSFAGAIVHQVRSGLKAAFSASRPSPEKALRKTADAIRAELRDALDDQGLKRKINDFVRQIRPKEPDYNKIAGDFKNMLTGIQIKEKVERDEEGIPSETLFEIVKKHPRVKPEHAEKITGAVKQMMQGGQGQAGESGFGFAQENETVKQIENFLRNSGVDALQPEKLKEGLNQMMSDPKTAKETVFNRLKNMDPAQLVSAVAGRKDIPEDQKQRITESVQKTISSFKESFSGSGKNAAEKAKQKAAGMSQQVQQKIRSYLDSLGEPGLSYEEIRADFQAILHDPKATPEILKERFKHLDRDTLVSIISSNPSIPPERADELVSRFEQTRDEILHKAEELETQVKQRVEEFRQEAAHQAENVRKATAAAAWWLFAIAVVSAGFAVLGGGLAAI